MKKLISLLLCGVMIIACSTEAAYKVSSNLTSSYVTDNDNQRYDNETLDNTLNDVLSERFPTADFEAVTSFGYVLLVGEVTSLNDKKSLEAICLRYPAVIKVFNYLTVNSKPDLDTNNSITKRVKERLERQYDINSKNLAVITVDNTVYIIGTRVGNLTALNNTIRDGIYSITGVKKVINLVVPGPEDYYTDK